jgi:hypothetical protein
MGLRRSRNCIAEPEQVAQCGKIVPMTIQVHNAELEALILERMKSGRYPSAEDALLEALRDSAMGTAEVANSSRALDDLTGMDLIAAMQASPCKDIPLEPERYRLPVRDVSI